MADMNANECVLIVTHVLPVAAMLVRVMHVGR